MNLGTPDKRGNLEASVWHSFFPDGKCSMALLHGPYFAIYFKMVGMLLVGSLELEAIVKSQLAQISPRI